MKKLMLCTLAVVMVTATLSGVALAAKRPGPGPQAGIEQAEVKKVPSYETDKVLNVYVVLKFPPGILTVDGQPFGTGHEGHTFAHLLIALTSTGLIRFTAGVTTPVTTAANDCTSLPTTDFSGEASQPDTLFALVATKVASGGAPTAEVLRFRDSVSTFLFTVQQVAGTDACNL
ncbi:MAG: hypothetical protein ACK4Z6_03995 [Candidatus Methylomirabilales bacterium]